MLEILIAFALGALAGAVMMRMCPPKLIAKASARPLLDPAPLGSRTNPHVLTREPLAFPARVFLSDIENRCLEMAQAWRQNNLDGRFDWVLIHLAPADWRHVSLLRDRRAGRAYDAGARIVYALQASRQQELDSWQQEVLQ